jgi:hypothetical protein
MKSHTLWTRNYTTITIGTIISAIGGVGLNFALSVLIYNKTGSTLLSACVCRHHFGAKHFIAAVYRSIYR